MMVVKALRAAGRRVLNRVWYVHPTAVMLFQATPMVCLQTLVKAARPSTERLHLRNLFTDGRRYYLRPLNNGFQMHSTSKVLWRRRKRTRVAAVLFGTFSEAGTGITGIQLNSRMTTLHFLDIFLLPMWMSLLLFFGPLTRQFAIIAFLMLFALSWLWHWYSAVLQATEMVYFIQVALEDLEAGDVPALAAVSQNVVYSPEEFQEQWQKFYEEQTGKE